MNNNIKAIILDVDGVIIGEKIGFNSPEPHIDVISRLKSIHENGIAVILCTAKPHFAIKSVIEAAELDNLHIIDGGSVIIDPIHQVIAKKYVIDNKEASRVIESCIKSGIYTEFYTVDDYIIQASQISNITDKHTHILQRSPKKVDDVVKESINSEITKIMPIAINESDKVRVTGSLSSYASIRLLWVMRVRI